MAISCTDYLDKAPESDISAADAFKNFKNFQGFTEELYLCMPDFTRGYWTTSWNWGEDDIMAVGINYHMSYKVDQGDFWGWQRDFDGWGSGFMEPSTEFNPNDRFKRGLWPAAWYGIRKCNVGLENMELMTAATQEEKNAVRGQLLFFRGWFHFMLMQYFGGLPYLDAPVAPDQAMTLPRETYQACADKAAKDFREAADLLPIDWDKSPIGSNTLGKNGFRINKITALAYLGKNYLWAASPLMKNVDEKMNVLNSKASTYEYDAEYAQKAADALGELLALVEGGSTQYKLVDFSEYSDLFYTWNRNMLPPGSTESILRAIAADAWQNSHYGVFTEFGGQILTGGDSFSMPTANYVNYAYGMANGLPLDDVDSNFDPTHPWKDRDPRFYHDIIFDGFHYVLSTDALSPEQKKYEYCSLYTGGGMRGVADASSTGYFIQKLTPHQCNEGDKWYDWDWAFESYLPYMRLADVYLMYAEARAAIATGVSDLTDKSMYCNSLSAVDAINALRDRVNSFDYPMEHVAPNLRDTREHFIDEVRRERAVELAFEGFRWNDLQRWLLLTEPPYTTKYSHEFERLEKDDWFKTHDPKDAKVGNFHREELITRHLESKHYWFPLPDKDIYLYEGFPQNPGW